MDRKNIVAEKNKIKEVLQKLIYKKAMLGENSCIPLKDVANMPFFFLSFVRSAVSVSCQSIGPKQKLKNMGGCYLSDG